MTAISIVSASSAMAPRNVVAIQRGDGKGVHHFLPTRSLVRNVQDCFACASGEDSDVGGVAGRHEQRGAVVIGQQQGQVDRRARGGKVIARPRILNSFQRARVRRRRPATRREHPLGLRC